MGASSPEIDQQIKDTRQQLDANLVVLERRAASTARRAVRIAAAAGIGLVAAAGIGFAVYKLRRRRSLAARVHDALPRSMRRLPRNLVRNARRPLPTVKVVIAASGKGREPGAWESMAQKVATTVAASAAGGLTSHFVGRKQTAAE